MHKQNTNQKPFNKLNTSRDNSHCFPEKRSGAVRDKNIPSQREEGAQKGSEHTENTILKTGLQHIKPKQALNAASSRFVGLLPMEQRELSWDDIVSAASTLRPALHISQESWGRACQTLTRYGAAICILLTDQAAQRNENPVRKPAAYFNTMITRAKNGELHLHKSIFGLLKREYEPEASNNNLVPDHKERS